jgi:hypothetical protein
LPFRESSSGAEADPRQRRPLVATGKPIVAGAAGPQQPQAADRPVPAEMDAAVDDPSRAPHRIVAVAIMG